MENETPRQDINVYADILTRIQMCRLPPKKKVLDLGAGGMLLREVYPYLSDITFVDLPEAENGTFQRLKHLWRKEPHYTFVETSCEDLSMFEDKSFGLVVFSHVIEHLTDEQIEKTMKEVNRVMEQGGTFLIATPNIHGRKLVGKYMKNDCHEKEFSGEELLDLVHKHGFKVVNEYPGIMEVEKGNTDAHTANIEPRMTKNLKNCYFLYFVCRRENE